MTKMMRRLKNAWPPLLVLAAAALVLAHYFEDFPNGWDQTEYAWCLQAGYLPHSPYLLFILLGNALHRFFSAPVALSLLAAMSGIVSLVLFHSIAKAMVADSSAVALAKAEGRGGLPAIASVAMALLGFTYLFIRQCATQEVYALQLLMVLAALRLALIPRPGAAAASGAVFGLALCTHNATLFLLPAFVLAWWMFGVGPALCRPRPRNATGKPCAGNDVAGTNPALLDSVKRTLSALVAAGAVVALFAALVFFLLPQPPTGGRAEFALRYLQGISAAKPAVATALEAATTPVKRDYAALLVKSVAALYGRLTDLHIPHTRLPIATGPIGFSLAHFVLAACGLVLAFRLVPRAAWFWLAWAGPYFAYELVKSNPDYGVYLPFLLPPMAFFLAVAVTWAVARFGCLLRHGTAPAFATVLATLAVLSPSLTLLVRHWGDGKADLVDNYSPQTASLMWLGEHLPANAIVIQPLAEWNANRVPYYLNGRAFVTRIGDHLLLFRPRGRFTPMNLTAYELLTTASLEALIRTGHPVYALEPDPLKGCATDELDAAQFEWSETRTVEGSGVIAPFAFYRAAAVEAR
jgi:hypothetical protein